MDATHIRAILAALTADPSQVAILRKERNALALELATNDKASREVISGTGNGTSFTASVTMTKADRLKLLQKALDYYDKDAVPSSWSHVRII